MNLNNIPVLGRINDVLKSWRDVNFKARSYNLTNVAISTSNVPIYLNGQVMQINKTFIIAQGTYTGNQLVQSGEYKYIILGTMSNVGMDYLFPKNAPHGQYTSDGQTVTGYTTGYGLGYALFFNASTGVAYQPVNSQLIFDSANNIWAYVLVDNGAGIFRKKDTSGTSITSMTVPNHIWCFVSTRILHMDGYTNVETLYADS